MGGEEEEAEEEAGREREIRKGAGSRCRLAALFLPPLACLCRGQSAELKATAALLTFLIALPFLGPCTTRRMRNACNYRC